MSDNPIPDDYIAAAAAVVEAARSLDEARRKTAEAQQMAVDAYSEQTKAQQAPLRGS